MAQKIAIIIEGEIHRKAIGVTLQDFGRDYPICCPDIDTSWQDPVEAAQQLQQEGVVALISAGSYGIRIRDAVSIPVVLIKRSRVSFAVTAQEAVRRSDHIAIIGRNGLFIDAAEQSRALLPEGVLIRGFDREEEIPAIMEEFRAAGVQLIIGGPNTVRRLSAQYGFEHMSVPFEKRDIMDAVTEAEQIVHTVEERFKNAQILKSIQDSVTEGILALDRNGMVTEANRSASDILRVPPQALLGHRLEDTILGSVEKLKDFRTIQPSRNQIIQVNGQILALSTQPILVDKTLETVILTFNQVEQIQKMEQDIRKRLHAKGHVANYTFERIIGSSQSLQNSIREAKRYAQVESTVMIYGPSGSGKEVFAQSIHNASRRAAAPFVVINCAALPESLLESILFGYEKGAFTGARSEGKRGLFEEAHGGTVFLDEISEMPLSVQARFLRVLQEKEVMPVGSNQVIPINVRVICATNRDLRKMVSENRFREDLYYRICVLQLNVAPLCERRDDIKDLANYFLYTKAKELEIHVNRISSEAMEYLSRLDLPGNVRQLSNIMERAIILSDSDTIQLETMCLAVGDHSEHVPVEKGGTGKLEDTDRLEEDIIRRALRKFEGHRGETAEYLGISPTTLWRKMKRYHITDIGKQQ